MASEQAPVPARPARRSPRGVADLPVRATSPEERAPADASLAGFKPKRRVAQAGQRPATDPPVSASPPAPAAAPRGGQKARSSSKAAAARRLIVNADDFGRSHSINEAVIRAHRHGILTTASLMVNGDAFEEAVALARQTPTLGVGLHLTLVCGKATCAPVEIPDLVNARGDFTDSPVAAGMRYFFQRGLQLQLAREIGAQFAKFKATGLALDHVNGHLNLHLHPTIFELLASRCLEWGIRHLRVTDDPYWLNRQLARGHFLYRASHAFIFRRLSVRARRILSRSNVRFTNHVFGLLQNARVDERYITRLLPALPRGDSELY